MFAIESDTAHKRQRSPTTSASPDLSRREKRQQLLHVEEPDAATLSAVHQAHSNSRLALVADPQLHSYVKLRLALPLNLDEPAEVYVLTQLLDGMVNRSLSASFLISQRGDWLSRGLTQSSDLAALKATVEEWETSRQSREQLAHQAAMFWSSIDGEDSAELHTLFPRDWEHAIEVAPPAELNAIEDYLNVVTLHTLYQSQAPDPMTSVRHVLEILACTFDEDYASARFNQAVRRVANQFTVPAEHFLKSSPEMRYRGPTPALTPAQLEQHLEQQQQQAVSLSTARHLVATEIACNPKVLSVLKPAWSRLCTMSTVPTAKGLKDIKTGHWAFGVHHISKKPVGLIDALTDKDLRLLFLAFEAEQEGLIDVSLQVPLPQQDSRSRLYDMATLPKAFAEFVQQYAGPQCTGAVDEMATSDAVVIEDEWWLQRAAVAAEALCIASPLLAKQYISELHSRSEQAVLNSMCSTVRDWISVRTCAPSTHEDRILSNIDHRENDELLSAVSVLVNVNDPSPHSGMMVYLDRDGNFKDTALFMPDRPGSLLKFIHDTRPGIVVVCSGEQCDHTAVEEQLEKWDEDMPSVCKVIVCNAAIGEEYARSGRSCRVETFGSEIDANIAIGTARAAQDPASELAQLLTDSFNSIDNERNGGATTGLLPLLHKHDPIYKRLPHNKALSAVKQVFVDYVVRRGIYVPEAGMFSHKNALLSFLPGALPGDDTIIIDTIQQFCKDVQDSCNFLSLDAGSAVTREYLHDVLLETRPDGSEWSLETAGLQFLRCSAFVFHEYCFRRQDDLHYMQGLRIEKQFEPVVNALCCVVFEEHFEAVLAKIHSTDKDAALTQIREAEHYGVQMVKTLTAGAVHEKLQADPAWDPLTGEPLEDELSKAAPVAIAMLERADSGVNDAASRCQMLMQEIRFPYWDSFATTYAPPSDDDLFKWQTGLCDAELQQGTLVNCKITEWTPYGLQAAVQNVPGRLEAFIPLNMAGTFNGHVIERMTEVDEGLNGVVKTGVVLMVDKVNCEVVVSCLAQDVELSAADFFTKFQRPEGLELDKYFDIEACKKGFTGEVELDLDVLAFEPAKILSEDKQRHIQHPCFVQATSSALTAELLDTKISAVGKALFKPGVFKPETGQTNIELQWLWLPGLCATITVKEDRRSHIGDNRHVLGTLSVDGEEYGEGTAGLHGILMRYIAPLNARVAEVTHLPFWSYAPMEKAKALLYIHQRNNEDSESIIICPATKKGSIDVFTMPADKMILHRVEITPHGYRVKRDHYNSIYEALTKLQQQA